uniref:nitroreductase family protein n=1 Tax=Algoriphagus sp. TaxID=1872435 RepID=UPI0040476E20
MIKKIKSKLNRLRNNILPQALYKSRFLSSLYYFFVFDSFSREHQAVLAGKVKHLKDMQKSKDNYFLLIRNTHRLEKGLLMRPKREIFAKDYIKETVECFEGVWYNKLYYQSDNLQMKWFYDVLSSYFNSSGEDKLINNLKMRFFKITEGNNFEIQSYKSIPYYRTDRTSISYEDFFELTRIRRSVRWFLNNPVPRELIDKAIKAANQSPSACNRQPFEYRIIDDPLLVEKVVNFPMGTKGYAHNIPVIIVAVGNLDAYFDERDRHLIYIDASLANMTLMLAFETLGLSSCPINWPDIEHREVLMDKFLSLEKYQRPIMCIGVGFPDPEGMVAFSEKRSLDQIRKYN